MLFQGLLEEPGSPHQSPMPAQYDAFADFYNRDWGEEYHAQIMGVLDQLLLNDLSPGDSILDVGCGTGAVAANLTQRGFSVTGIDESEAMLAFARVNAPCARFLRADARSFHLESRFTASIATFEAMNHLLHPADLAASFHSIARATGRCFVFDMNREAAFHLFWNGESTVEQDGLVCRLTSAYDPLSRIARVRTEVAGHVTEIRERFYESLEIESMLASAGFRTVRCFDGAADLGMWGNVAIGRSFYQCFK